MVDKPLTESEIRAKIIKIDIRVAQLKIERDKYLKDLEFYANKEKSQSAATEQAQ